MIMSTTNKPEVLHRQSTDTARETMLAVMLAVTEIAPTAFVARGHHDVRRRGPRGPDLARRTRRPARAIVLGLVTAVVLAACGDAPDAATPTAQRSTATPSLSDGTLPSPEVAPAPSSPNADPTPLTLQLDDPPPMDLELVFGNGVTAWTRAATQEELPRAAAGIEQLTGRRADGLRVHAYHDRDELLGAYTREVCHSRTRAEAAWERASTRGRAGDGYIFLFLTDEHRTESGREDLIELLTHEYVHTIQHDGAPPGRMVGDGGWGGPMWLSEGVANYLTCRYVAHWRQRDCRVGCFRDVFAGWEARVRGVASHIDIPLAELEGRADYVAFLASCDLSLAPLTSLAVHELAQRSNLAALLDYYRLARQHPWQDAFEQTFGLAVDDFYDQFAAERASW